MPLLVNDLLSHSLGVDKESTRVAAEVRCPYRHTKGKGGGSHGNVIFYAYGGERIREAQKNGAFENLPGKGKPLQLTEDQSMVPEVLAHVVPYSEKRSAPPPEAEVQKEIHTLQHLRKYVEERGRA